MNAIEYKTEADFIHITIERSALNSAILVELNEFLQNLLQVPEKTALMTASELRRLPVHERKRIMAEQFSQAAELYNENPDAIIEDRSDWSDAYAR